MPFDDVPEFAKQLRKMPGVAPAALEFTILTAARSGEVLGGRWNEVDLTERVWTVPATRMKGVRQQSRHWQQVRIAVLGSPARGRRLAIDQSACA
jgi:integrase